MPTVKEKIFTLTQDGRPQIDTHSFEFTIKYHCSIDGESGPIILRIANSIIQDKLRLKRFANEDDVHESLQANFYDYTSKYIRDNLDGVKTYLQKKGNWEFLVSEDEF